jgi:hypothetical protein
LLRGAPGEDEAPFGQVWHKLICACRKSQLAYQIVVERPKSVLQKIGTLLEVLALGFIAFSVVQPPVRM